jgi:ParB-like chromosome segregation protein Spo0J
MAKTVDKNIITLEKLKIVQVPLVDILPNDYNPNRQSDRDFELLCRSIEEDGFTQPILVHEKTNQIVDGEHRWRACKVLGFETVPVVYVNMTKEQMMISTLRHNRARGSENINMAADVLRDLQRLGALDHAADSLLLDDIELQVMLEDIPQSELILRHPGEKMTAADVQVQLDKERRHEETKHAQDTNQAERERASIFTLMCRYYWYEYKQIKTAFENVEGESASDKIVNLCATYSQNPEAKAYLDTPDEKPWGGR